MTRESRLPPFDADAASPAQRAVLDDILKGPRKSLEGPFLAWIHSPELADPAQRLGAVCRYGTGLPTRLSELAILVTAARWRCQAEWHIHLPIALEAGLSPAVAEAIRRDEQPELDDPDERLIWAFARELHDTTRVSDRTYDAAVARFGLPVTVNLVGLLGYYTLVAMTLNSFAMRAGGTDSLPFPE